MKSRNRCFYEPLEQRVLLTNVVINGTGGADTIFIEDLPGDATTMRYGVSGGFAQLIAWADVDSITVNAGAGADTVHVRRLRSSVPVTINGEGGNDVAMLGNGDIDTNLVGSVLMNGGAGTDRVEMLDSADASGPDEHALFYASEAGQFGFFYQKTGFPAPSEGVRWDGTTEQVRLELSNFGDSVDVQDDVGNVTIIGGSGADEVSWGNGDIDTNMGAASLRFEGNGNPAGSPDALLLDDSADAGGDTHRFDRNGTTGTYTKDNITGTVSFLGVEDVHLTTGQSQSTATYVDGLPSSTDLLVEGLLFGADTITIGGGDIDTNVLGDVSFDGFSDGTVIFNDTTDGPGADAYTLDFGTLTKGSRSHTFANVTSVTLDASPNADSINIENSFGYELVVHGNAGDDAIAVGDGDLTGSANATIYGGDGADTLRFDDTTAAAANIFSVDSNAAGGWVDHFNGNVRTRYDSVNELTIDASPHADQVTTAAVPQFTTLYVNGRGGADAIAVQGHPTLNAQILPRVRVDGGAGLDTVEVNTDNQGSASAEFPVSQDLASLQMGSLGRLRLAAGNRLIEVNGATLPASGFELDLTDGFFVRRGNASFSYYWDRVATGYNGGLWNGMAIHSSTAAASAVNDGLGMARASELFGGGGGVVQGINLAADDIIIAHVLSGDANLDGTVNLQDFNRLAANFGQFGTTWAEGNFNYDNVTNLLDFNALAGNFGNSAAPDAVPTRPGISVGELLKMLEQGGVATA
jgi:hypothetical protein